MIERPLDLLNELKGKSIIVTCKDGDVTEGTLLAFDIHINLALEDHSYNPKIKRKKKLFVRGENVVFVEENEDKK